MRRVNGDMRNASNAVDTLNAAADAIALAEARAPPDTSQKRRWCGCLSAYWCFGSQKHKKRIGHSILVPEPSSSTIADAPPPQNLLLPTPIGAHFAAPPSSPASFIPSEPPSASQSPAGLVSCTSISAYIYSPGGPHSIFAIGPYAHETQLVSPPTFSTYTTEPSTAPFTPPPESVHLTTPSSPEVPFAQFLDRRFMQSQYDYPAYQYYPGSPAGQLISPSSVISGSGTSSPLPDQELFGGGPYYSDIRFGVPPRLLNLRLLPVCDYGSGLESGSLTPENNLPKSHDGFLLHHQDSPTDEQYDQETSVSQRVSFELLSEDVVRCVEKEPTVLPKALQALEYRDDDNDDDEEKSLVDEKSTTMIDGTSTEKPQTPDVDEGQRCQRQRSVSLGSIKEFNFDNVNKEEPHKPCLGPNWWTNDNVKGKEAEQPSKNWSFFPVAQSGAS